MAEYTPGPWFCSGGGFNDNGCIDYSIHADGMVISRANARLIAAAPELLEALEMWMAYDNLDEADFSEIGPMLLYANAINATRAAITKAKGPTHAK